jgi:tripartite-type tricarboxylate transporter receptor subunit TctC
MTPPWTTAEALMMHSKLSRRNLMLHGLSAASLSAAAWCGATPALGAEAPYPSKTLIVISPFPPGGLNDTSARAVSRALQASLGVSSIVENRPGAGTMIALEHLARQPADGHTLLICGDTNMAVMPHLQKNLSFSLESDFAPVTSLVSAPAVLIVRPTLKANSVAQLIALAKASPGKLSYASAGNATPPHMIGELFKLRAGIAVEHIPFKGAAEGLLNVMSDQVDFIFVDIASASSQVRSGKVRALAVSTSTRSRLLPQLPTVAESGLSGFDGRAWQGVIVRAGTPAARIATLNHAIVEGIVRPEIGAVFETQGATLATSTPQEFGQMIQAERSKFGELIKAAHIELG